MTVEAAKSLCIKAHRGQWRNPRLATTKEAASDGIVQKLPDDTYILTNGDKLTFDAHGVEYISKPYSSHSIAVAAMMTTNEEKIIALLHDILEDTSYTYKQLLDLGLYTLSDTARNALKLLTKQPGQSYELYIFNISCCTLAKRVKIGDIVHNISCNPTERQKLKYYASMKILLASI